MGKHETLPFKMTVERGKLVPADAHDAERLDTWRNGTPVNVTFVRDGGRVMERKWWAVLNRAVKECKTPWKTAAEASEAIKLAIGVVNLTKTVGGEFMAYPKSLTELDDPDLDEAVRQMMDVVHHVTGVDPEEWKKQVAHIRDDEPSDNPTPSDEQGSGGVPSSTVAADNSEPASGGPVEEGDNPGESAAPSSELSDDHRAKLFMLEECADVMFAAATHLTASERVDRLDKARMAWLAELPNDKAFVQKAFETCSRLLENPAGRDQVIPYLKGQARKWMGVAS